MDLYNKTIIEDEELLGEERRIFQSPLIDRTNTIKQNLKLISRMPTETTPKSFSEIMDIRAKQLLKKAKNTGRDIRVSYSGGIDSTSVLCALIKYNEEYPEVNITVVMSDESYYEYPEFYENHLKSRVAVQWVTSLDVLETLVKESEKPYYIVTGEIGDQLFGSAIMFTLSPELLEDKWATNLKLVNYLKLEPIAKQNPFFEEDRSLANFLWWLNFTLKYQWVQLRMCVSLGPEHFRNTIHFFDSDLFQSWAITHPIEEKFPDFTKPQTYKMPAKQYIFDFAKDLWYLKSKIKVPSLCNTVSDSFAKDLSRITSDLKIYKFRQEEYEVI